MLAGCTISNFYHISGWQKPRRREAILDFPVFAKASVFGKPTPRQDAVAFGEVFTFAGISPACIYNYSLFLILYSLDKMLHFTCKFRRNNLYFE